MSIAEIVSLIAMVLVSGGLATYLVQIVKRVGLSSRAKWCVSVAISAVFGLATSWLAGDVLGLVTAWGDLGAAEVFAVMSATYLSANGFYLLYIKPKAV